MLADTGAVASIAEKLKTILEREPAMRGRELESAVSEKEALLAQLEQALSLDQSGAGERAAGASEILASLSFANGLALKFGRLREQLWRLQNREAKPVKMPRVDLIS